MKSSWTRNKIVADIALYASDRAIITVWDGLISFEYVVFNISSIVQIQDSIKALKAKYSIRYLK
jgi:hypothetical protein